MAKRNMRVVYETLQKLANQIESQLANGGKADDSVVDALGEGFQDVIEFEKCFLISCQDKFWGNLLMDIETEVDFKQRGAVDLKINEPNPVVISFNPLFCLKNSFPELTGLIINELTKLVYLHPCTFSKINHEKDSAKHTKLEKASDAASTALVKSDIRLVSDESPNNGCRLPKDKYTSVTMNAELGVNSRDKMPIEYYYSILDKFKKEGSSTDGGDDASKGGKGNSQQSGSSTQSGKTIASPDNNAGENCHNWEKGDESNTKNQLISIVSDAYKALDERSRGYLPGSLCSQIDMLLKPPEINWKQVLRKMVGSVPVPYRKTRTRLNRRQPFRADLCGQLPKRTVNIICCFDTSGSMSDDDLKYCMNEVFNIVKSYEGYSVTILECDMAVGRVYTAKNMNELKTTMTGRGGTSFIPAIEYINGEGDFKNNPKYPNAGRYRDALMVYFTDGYGDEEIPKPKTFRNLWVVLHDVKALSLKEPYGDVKSLSMDEEYKKRHS